MTSTLARWLALRSHDELSGILSRRPDAVAGQQPRSLGDLAGRLQAQHSLAALMRELPLPCMELLETLLVFGPASTAKVAATLRLDAADPNLTGCLHVLRMWVAAWDFEDCWHVSGSLKAVLPAPLRLGPPIAELLVSRTVEDLRSRAHTLGVAAGRTKTAIIDDLVAFFRDGAAVRALVEQAPSAQRELITEAAWRDPVLSVDGVYLYTGRPDPALSWLVTHSLVIADWQRVMVPREVALAIRGDVWHPTLTAAPSATVAPATNAAPSTPAPHTAPTEHLDRDAAAAAQQAMSALTGLVDAAGETGIAILRAGGVGVKEVRRLAKAIGVDEGATRLHLEIAHAAGLLDVDHEALVPTEGYDAWIGLSAADKLATILDAWTGLTVVPLIGARPDGVKGAATLAADSYGAIAAELRHDVVASLGAAGGAVTRDGLVATMAWRRPIFCRMLADPALAVGPLLAEAHLLGVAARNTLTSLGRALLDGDVPSVAGSFVAPAATTAIFQADLTIVVTGTPAPRLRELLDAAADAESRGAAATWRASTASVRRALDAGRSPDELIAALRGASANGELPQPLEYLITDVGRRHGEVRVRAVKCVLRSDDPSLLAEIAAARGLAKLHLTPLAPSVLASPEPPDYVLANLRIAGYAPVGEDAAGASILERARRRRAPEAPTTRQWVRASAAPDPDELAKRLLAAPGLADTMLYPTPESRSSTLATLRRGAGHLSEPELRLLADALDAERSVWISYVSAEGEATTRVIEPFEVAGSVLIAYCRLRDDERHFLLRRIDEVRPG